MHRALALAPAVLLLAAGCGKLDRIDIVRSGTAVVPGGSASLPTGGIATFPLSLGRGALQSQGIDPNDVDSAKLVGLRLEVTQGTSLEKWFDAVSLYVEAPGLPRALVAQKTAIPPGTSAVDLDTPGVDLKPYVLADTTTVTAEGAGSQPAVDTTVKATATVRVDVNVTGLLK